jgi:PPK2 family polyphosphate:nucleotide phosphotransferase
MSFLYTIDRSDPIDLDDYSTKKVEGLSKEEALTKVLNLGDELSILQEALYAASTHSVLVVLQAMDTGGKDGTVSHVFKFVNPQGCGVTAFKEPTPDQLAHDFLWRAHQAVPAKGKLQIFNRSYYEDVLVVRVHDLVPKSIWSDRYAEIEQFESLLVANKTIIFKFFLHISKSEQRNRLVAREENPNKAWKLSANDWHERLFWDKYVKAYEDALAKTATKHAPWYIVPSDDKWYRNYAIAEKIVDVLKSYKPEWDKSLVSLGQKNKAELAKIRAGNSQLAKEAPDLTGTQSKTS